MFQPPAHTPFNFLSLGAGVQSSTLALMAARGVIAPTPTAAIFADTQAEPASVYRWLDWLETEIARSPNPFPVIRITRGSLTTESLRIRQRVKSAGKPWSKSLIPAHVANADGTKGIMGRACTYDFKLRVLIKTQKNRAGVGRRQKTLTVTTWIGISLDEVHRMKPSQEAWCQHRWPLIELGMKRHDCLRWMEAHGYPRPPRSACFYCPFHSDAEWRRLRDEEPVEFAKAVQFERDLQDVKRLSDNMDGVPYLHASLKPLDEVDFTTDTERGQGDLFGNDCTGMCGV